MIIKGPSPTVRHVSRTHRVALDWLFDRVNLGRKIQTKYVDTENQLVDMLTKGSFTRYEWNHLLRLFNILNFSMFSCSHFSNLLSDPIRKQSAAMAKKRQEATSSEGSPMAKPEPTSPAMAKSRPMNLVLHNPLNARKNPPQDLSDPVNQENAEEKQVGVQTSIRKLMRNTSRSSILKWGNRKTLKLHTLESGRQGWIFGLKCHETGAGGEHKEGVS